MPLQMHMFDDEKGLELHNQFQHKITKKKKKKKMEILVEESFTDAKKGPKTKLLFPDPERKKKPRPKDWLKQEVIYLKAIYSAKKELDDS